jgi:phosphoketolase
MPALSPDLMEKMDAYWRAANHLSVGQVYLQDNPLLESPLERKHMGVASPKPDLTGRRQGPSNPPATGRAAGATP